MDIHKPKPVHSWREFLSEIGVVVLGIVIALSGEQAVETLHRKVEVSALRADLHEEARQVLADAEKCEVRTSYLIGWLNKRTAQVQIAVWQSGRLAPREPNKTPVCASPDIPIWRSAKSGGKPNLLTKGEVNAFAEVEYIQTHLDAIDEKKSDAEYKMKAFIRQLPKRNDGTPDFSVFAKRDLHDYLILLTNTSELNEKYRTWLHVLIGAEKAVLAGKVDLNDIYASERKASDGDVEDVAM
jgi:hypothetical protein